MNKNIKILFLALMCFMTFQLNAQNTFKSSKYGYTLSYPEIWKIKDVYYMPNIDFKLIDGNGNSFIVSVSSTQFSTEGYIKEIEKLSTTQLANGFKNSNFKSVDILLKERRSLNNKECYYIKMKSLLSTGKFLISELYIYSSGKYEYAINASYNQNEAEILSPIIKKMMSSFKF
ncbi:MAG TPA: hypothetical protein VLZ75_12680 [Chitinophagales bacterium]|nr:hypothetical protein [Chitinophagales bacterium]